MNIYRKAIESLALLIGALSITGTAWALPNCTRKPGQTTETSPAGVRHFPLTGPCHVLPMGPNAGVPFAGFMIIVAAGGWNSNPQKVRDDHSVYAPHFARDGFFTYTVEHTPGSGTALGPHSGHTGFGNLVRHYDEVRAFADSLPGGRPYPICAYGVSSGGHFALLLGVARPALNCIIAQASPTDLRNVSESMPAWVRDIATDAFGSEHLPAFSPIAWPARSHLRQKTLLGIANSDPAIGRTQALDFCASRPQSSHCYILETQNGSVPFTHGTLVTPEAFITYFTLHHLFAP